LYIGQSAGEIDWETDRSPAGAGPVADRVSCPPVRKSRHMTAAFVFFMRPALGEPSH
jgi:hypothetical protein